MRERAANPLEGHVDPVKSRELPPKPWVVSAAVSAGGAVGALARYGVQEVFPHRPGEFAWATFIVNVSGCLLIGVLMVLVSEVWTRQRLLHPFLGVGVLGGFTTFSAYVIDIQQALAAGAVQTALLYLTATLVCALAAVWTGIGLARWASRVYRNRQVPR